MFPTGIFILFFEKFFRFKKEIFLVECNVIYIWEAICISQVLAGLRYRRELSGQTAWTFFLKRS